MVEVVEYFGSLLIENDSGGGYTNNMQDLIANTLGAAVGASWAFRAQEHGLAFGTGFVESGHTD